MCYLTFSSANSFVPCMAMEDDLRGRYKRMQKRQLNSMLLVTLRSLRAAFVLRKQCVYPWSFIFSFSLLRC